MEKPAESKYVKKCHRLLKRCGVQNVLPRNQVLPVFVLFFSAVFVCAQAPVYEPVLTVTETSCAAGGTVSFLIQVPYQEPSAVRYTMPSSGSNFRLDQAKKTRFTQAGQFFTNIELTFTFPEVGTVMLPDAVFSYAKKTFTVVFPPVTVRSDPATVVPAAYWRIRETAGRVPRVGEKITVDLYVRNAVEVMSFSAGLSENALFEQSGGVQTVLGSADDVLSVVEGIVVSRYVLTPLTEGIVFLPDAELNVRAADGSEKNIRTAQQRIRVAGTILHKERVSPSAPVIENAFRAVNPEEGFSEHNSAYSVQTETTATKIAETIAALRLAERKAAFPVAERKERKAFEETVGITESIHEPAVFWITPLYVCALLCAALFFVLKLITKRFRPLLSAAALFLLTAALFLHAASVKPAAAAAARALKTVPEQSASNSAVIVPGTRVVILALADGWLLVRDSRGRSGWITENDVLRITSIKKQDK